MLGGRPNRVNFTLARHMASHGLRDDRDGARPAGGTAAHFDRKAAHHEPSGRQRFEIVELLDVAIADLAAGSVAFPDQTRVAGGEIFLLGVDERRVPAPAVGAGHAHAALERRELMIDAFELGFDVARAGDITIGEMTEVELDGGLKAPFERYLVDCDRALAAIHG